jgi:hypothetical protein
MVWRQIEQEKGHATGVRLEWQLLGVELSKVLDVAIDASEIPLHHTGH